MPPPPRSRVGESQVSTLESSIRRGTEVKRLGVIVNPIAGMGGRCGLKGTDGEDVLARARALGAVAESPDRATLALRQLTGATDLRVLVAADDMGEREAKGAGFEPTVVYDPGRRSTSGEDTRQAARALVAAGADLVLFTGGDGTARDVCEAIGPEAVCLGVPAGCKIHSGVFAVSPRAAGELAALYLADETGGVRTAEVMDIDEAAFREGRVTAGLFGYLNVPCDERRVQGVKAGRSQSEGAAVGELADYLLHSFGDAELLIIGPGSTTFEFKKRLGLTGTLLGVDVLKRGRLAGVDVSEAELLELLEGRDHEDATIVVTVIGGQGYIFGRGNQQLGPRVLERVGLQNIVVVATKGKIAGLGGRPLLVDTGDERMNAMLSGYTRVITGYGEQVVVGVAG